MGEYASQGRKILLTLLMRNLKLREGKSLPQGHRNHLRQAQPVRFLGLSSLHTVSEVGKCHSLGRGAVSPILPTL